MGYYSFFELYVSGLSDESEWEKIWNAMESIGIQEMFAHTYPDGKRASDYYWDPSNKVLSFSSSEMHKWYDETEDLLKFSKLFPDLLFKVHRIGEDSEDITDDYFFNGTYECCKWEPTKPSRQDWFEAFEWKGNG